MIKQFTAFIFLIAFASLTFSKAFVVFDYFTNTKAFAVNCENKVRPQIHCNGKCQMMIKLQQEEKKDNQNPERKAENKNELVLSSKSFSPALYWHVSLQKKTYPSIATGKATKMPRSILRPPIG